MHVSVLDACSARAAVRACCCRTQVPITDAGTADMMTYTAGCKCMELIGFTDRDNVPRWCAAQLGGVVRGPAPQAHCAHAPARRRCTCTCVCRAQAVCVRGLDRAGLPARQGHRARRGAVGAGAGPQADQQSSRCVVVVGARRAQGSGLLPLRDAHTPD
jgi:hypothetical protein